MRITIPKVLKLLCLLFTLMGCEQHNRVAVQQAKTPFDITNTMGAGWNLGNSLDSIGGEIAWGNPKTTKSIIDAIHTAGFKTLRVPVTWDRHFAEPNYTIDPAWFKRVNEVINYGLDNDMYVIINIHHTEGWQEPTRANAAQAENQLIKLWQQIAAHFQTYDHRLIFETMNEPRVQEDWWGTPEYFEVVNQLNAAAVTTIRASGGNNTTRMIMVPGYVAGGNPHQLAALKIPNDPMVALSVHAYFPFQFAMEEQGTDKFTDQAAIDDVFIRLNQEYVKNGIAVVMGEWGTTDKNNLSERVKHAEYYVKTATQNGIPTIYWDNNNFNRSSKDAMGLYNRMDNEWTYPQLRDAIIKATQ